MNLIKNVLSISVLWILSFVTVVIAAGTGDSIVGWDNYCWDRDLKTHLWEECDDWNWKDWDWCSINCECESWYSCLEDGSVTMVVTHDPLVFPNNNWSNSDSWNNGDWNGDEPWIKDMMMDRNRTPLNLWDQTPDNAKMPLDAPMTWASLEQLRMMWMAVAAEEQATFDIVSTLPERAAWYVAKPSYLPLTWWAATSRPSRITIS